MLDNLDIYFLDLGVDCSDGVINFKGILDYPDGLFANQMVISTQNSVIVKTTDSSRITGKDLTVDGVAYKITSRKKIDDGQLTLIELGK